MSASEVREYLKKFKKTDKIRKIRVPITSIEDASDALGVLPSKIVKSSAFLNKKGDGCILIVLSGDATVDKARYKTRFRYIPDELTDEQLVEYTGYDKLSLCPFAVNEEFTKIYVDKSVKRFDCVYCMAGDEHTIVKFTSDELFECSQAEDWVEVGKAW